MVADRSLLRFGFGGRVEYGERDAQPGEARTVPREVRERVQGGEAADLVHVGEQEVEAEVFYVRPRRCRGEHIRVGAQRGVVAVVRDDQDAERGQGEQRVDAAHDTGGGDIAVSEARLRLHCEGETAQGWSERRCRDGAEEAGVRGEAVGGFSGLVSEPQVQ